MIIILFMFVFQLKHISRYVMDILIALAKTMDLISVQYLLKQIASIPITHYSKQTLLLSSLLTRNIWTAGLSGCCPEERSNQKVSPKKMPCKYILSYFFFFFS